MTLAQSLCCWSVDRIGGVQVMNMRCWLIGRRLHWSCYILAVQVPPCAHAHIHLGLGPGGCVWAVLMRILWYASNNSQKDYNVAWISI